jgi:hypothetical protein
MKAEEKLARKKNNKAEVKSLSRTKAREFPMTRHTNLKMRLRNHIVTRKEEEFPAEDKMLEEVLLEEEEEAEGDK